MDGQPDRTPGLRRQGPRDRGSVCTPTRALRARPVRRMSVQPQPRVLPTAARSLTRRPDLDAPESFDLAAAEVGILDRRLVLDARVRDPLPCGLNQVCIGAPARALARLAECAHRCGGNGVHSGDGRLSEFGSSPSEPERRTKRCEAGFSKTCRISLQQAVPAPAQPDDGRSVSDRAVATSSSRPRLSAPRRLSYSYDAVILRTHTVEWRHGPDRVRRRLRPTRPDRLRARSRPARGGHGRGARGVLAGALAAAVRALRIRSAVVIAVDRRGARVDPLRRTARVGLGDLRSARFWLRPRAGMVRWDGGRRPIDPRARRCNSRDRNRRCRPDDRRAPIIELFARVDRSDAGSVRVADAPSRAQARRRRDGSRSSRSAAAPDAARSPPNSPACSPPAAATAIQRPRSRSSTSTCRSPTVAVRLGTPEKTLLDFALAPPEDRSVVDFMVTHASGARVLLGPQRAVNPEWPVTPRSCARCCASSTWRASTWSVLDVSPELSPLNTTALSACDDVFVVVVPTAGGVQDAYRSTEALAPPRAPPSAALHRQSIASRTPTSAEPMADLGGQLVGDIPEDDARGHRRERASPRRARRDRAWPRSRSAVLRAGSAASCAPHGRA